MADLYGGLVPAVAPHATAAGPGGESRGTRQRFPFGVIDEVIHLLDTDTAPWSVQLEARVAGTLHDDRLRRALGEALGRHPMARARKVASWPTLPRHRWEVAATVDLDPLRVVTCSDDRALGGVRSELQSRVVPLVESPPLRVVLAHHGGGDVVMLNANHAAMDGFGALRLLQSVARAYAGEADPVPAVDFDDARRLPEALTATDLRTHVGRYLALAEKLRDVVSPPAHLATEGRSDEPGYGFVHVALSPERTAAIVGLDHPGTVNDALVAALHRAAGAWNEAHGVARQRLGVLVPANLRPPEWRREVVGNFSLPARVSTNRRHRRTPAAALAAVSRQTSRMKRSGMGTPLVEVLAGSHRVPLWAKEMAVSMIPVTRNRLVDTAMLSNLGALADPPSFGPEAGPVSEMWFSAPARMPLGLSVGALTVAGRMHLVFRYRHRLFDHAAASRFAERFLAELDALAAR